MKELTLTNRTIAAQRYIPYPDGYYLGAAADLFFRRKGAKKSRFFACPDFFNKQSDQTLTILPHFRTYQQTTEYTCGPCAALMVLDYFGNTDWHELEIAEQVGASPERGTFTAGMVRFFNEIGWNVQSSLYTGNPPHGATFRSPLEFREWVIDCLKRGVPIMAEWMEWMGHWQVVIGYDRVNEDSLWDDSLIMADSYQRGGYSVVPALRFYHMWRDADLFPEEHCMQQWLTAEPADR